MRKRIPSAALFLTLLALAIAPAQAQPDKLGATKSPRVDFQYKAASAPLSDDFLLIFAIPAEQLASGVNAITVTVYGDQDRLAVDAFSKVGGLGEGSTHLVLEAFSANPQIRRAVHEAAAGGRRIEIVIDVNGESVQRLVYDELEAASAAALAHEILPRALRSDATGPDGTDANGGPFTFIPICGNDVCESTSFPPENCFNCPEDCGGPCNFCGDGFCTFPESCETCEEDCGPCPGCPTDLGNVVVETPLFALSILGSDCWLDHLQPNQQVIYNRRSTIARRMTVNRVLECDGTITETVVPGTVVFICLDCWQRTDEQCNGPMDWTPPCTL